MLDDLVQKTQISPKDWSLGSPDAPVTILEYGDFECPHCAMARPVLESLVEDNPDTIRLVYRHFPITTIHPHALMAAESAEAAGAQGKFWGMQTFRETSFASSRQKIKLVGRGVARRVIEVAGDEATLSASGGARRPGSRVGSRPRLTPRR